MAEVSKFWPYEKVQTGYVTMVGAEEIPLRILTYLLDLPDRTGYLPADDNRHPRVRLAKYLWYDGGHPLAQPLPTPEEKRSMLFDGNEPVLNTEEEKARHPKGYRLYPQKYWGQSQLVAGTTVKCYLGRIIPVSPYVVSIGLVFEILVNSNQENTTKTTAYSRAYNIEQCILEAMHGVNFTGIGVADFSRQAHIDNGSSPIVDEGTNVGRRLKLSLTWAESEEDLP